MGSIVNPNNYPAKENVFTILVVALTWAMFGMYIPESSLFLLIGVFVLVLIGVVKVSSVINSQIKCLLR